MLFTLVTSYPSVTCLRLLSFRLVVIFPLGPGSPEVLVRPDVSLGFAVSHLLSFDCAIYRVSLVFTVSPLRRREFVALRQVYYMGDIFVAN